MSDSEDTDTPPEPTRLFVDAQVFNILLTALYQCINEGVDSVEICIDERDLDNGKRCHITVKAEASDFLGEFENELEPSEKYSCINRQH